MYFNSFQFLIFLAAFFPVFFATPNRFRIPLLLVASYYFYACFDPYYLWLIILSTAISYTAGYAIDVAQDKKTKSLILLACIVPLLGLLFYYKYLNFTIDNLNWIARPFQSEGANPLFDPVKLILPIGISFFTFQAIAYAVDVFRKEIRAERNVVRFATFKAFFPQLVAGPIERAPHLLPQFFVEKHIRFDNIRAGLQWIALGTFKKMVIADSFAVVVDTVYRQPEQFSGPIYAVGAIFFGFQVYCDFAGYSDIAVGVARLFGYDLMINFRQPFLARSIAEHWQRWHTSLMSWFRDYIFIPLGGSRVSTPRWAFNIFAVFFISGVWHGANWTYIAWGCMHAFYFLLQRAISKPYQWLTRAAQLHRLPYFLPIFEWAGTMVLVFVSYLFFRARNIHDATYMVTHLFDVSNFNAADLLVLGMQKFELALSAMWILIMMAVDYCLAFQPKWVMALWSFRAFRWAIYSAAVYAIAFFGVFEKVEFIYFQF